MVGKEPDIGPTAWVVAKNVERLRTAQNMNMTQLSERLRDAANWAINAVGIRRIESGERRVTPDDLTALAVALGVSPITLLMPAKVDKSDLVSVTGFDDGLTAEELWDWLAAEDTLPQTAEQVRTVGPLTRMMFVAAACPSWAQERKRDENVAGLLEKLKELGVGGIGDN
jgi:transcriptional regulator with XRE-family HTH domain